MRVWHRRHLRRLEVKKGVRRATTPAPAALRILPKRHSLSCLRPPRRHATLLRQQMHCDQMRRLARRQLQQTQHQLASPSSGAIVFRHDRSPRSSPKLLPPRMQRPRPQPSLPVRPRRSCLARSRQSRKMQKLATRQARPRQRIHRQVTLDRLMPQPQLQRPRLRPACSAHCKSRPMRKLCRYSSSACGA